MIDKKHNQKKNFATQCIHAGQSADPLTGAVSQPIYANTTFKQDAPGEHKGYVYGRANNPTRHAFERCLAALENGNHALAFASGMAATNAVCDLLPAGAHVIVCDDVYGGTYRLFERVRKGTTGVQVDYVDMTQRGALEKAIRPETKMIWVETPTNPLMKVIDLEYVASVAPKHKILSAVDNTFASPYVQKPLDFGFDIVVHSITKYISGHSDVIGGAVIMNDAEIADKIKFIHNATGGVLGPFESYLALRSLKTLDVRMQRHCDNAMKVAVFLESHPKISAVYYPGLKSHPQHDIAKKQMNGFGGMMSATIKGDLDAAKRMLSACTVFTLAESLGGVESLIEHPAIMTHASIPKEQREAIGIDDGLIRLSVGIENIEDLIDDLRQALQT